MLTAGVGGSEIGCDAAVVRTPNGIRTRATAVKGRGPRPLDDGGVAPCQRYATNNFSICCTPSRGIEPRSPALIGVNDKRKS